jgi:2-iminobutanoate/2-iminopropanoate deaminase
MVYAAQTMNRSKPTDLAPLIEVRTEDAPAPVGPYSQAIRIELGQDNRPEPEAAGLVFVSGQIPLDPKTGKLVDGEIEDETRQVLANLRAVLSASGASLASVVKATVYLTDMSLFPRVNAIYAEAFDSDPAPARATVEVSALPLGAHVEIDAIARC